MEAIRKELFKISKERLRINLAEISKSYKEIIRSIITQNIDRDERFRLEQKNYENQVNTLYEEFIAPEENLGFKRKLLKILYRDLETGQEWLQKRKIPQNLKDLLVIPQSDLVEQYKYESEISIPVANVSEIKLAKSELVTEPKRESEPESPGGGGSAEGGGTISNLTNMAREFFRQGENVPSNNPMTQARPVGNRPSFQSPKAKQVTIPIAIAEPAEDFEIEEEDNN